MLKRFTLPAFATLSLALLVSTQAGCDSSSNAEAATEEFTWTLSTDDFASGEHSIELPLNNGLTAQLIPDAGGTTGTMTAGDASAPVSFVYTTEAELTDELPELGILTVRFTSPRDAATIDLFATMGAEILPSEETGEVGLPDDAAITFYFGFTPFLSVKAAVEARPNSQFALVRANWTSFDSVETSNQSLGAWVILDMLRSDFSINDL